MPISICLNISVFASFFLSFLSLTQQFQVNLFAKRLFTFRLKTSIASDFSETYIVDKLIERVHKTERGLSVTSVEKDIINKEIEKLITVFQNGNNTTNPLTDSRLFGNYDVSYVGPGPNESDGSNPAGGKFRGAVGKYIFKTKGLYQNILPRGLNNESGILVVNSVYGRLFQIIPFHVILTGFARALNRHEIDMIQSKCGTKLSEATAEVKFNKPLFCFGSPNGFGLRIISGVESSVILDTPYLDNKIRLGIGSRGSYFIFKRVDDVNAEKWMSWFGPRRLMPNPELGRKFGALIILMSVINMFVKTNIKFLNWCGRFASFLFASFGIWIILKSLES
jgi:hypothetical protein